MHCNLTVQFFFLYMNNTAIQLIGNIKYKRGTEVLKSSNKETKMRSKIECSKYIINLLLWNIEGRLCCKFFDTNILTPFCLSI